MGSASNEKPECLLACDPASGTRLRPGPQAADTISAYEPSSTMSLSFQARRSHRSHRLRFNCTALRSPPNHTPATPLRRRPVLGDSSGRKPCAARFARPSADHVVRFRSKRHDPRPDGRRASPRPWRGYSDFHRPALRPPPSFFDLRAAHDQVRQSATAAAKMRISAGSAHHCRCTLHVRFSTGQIDARRRTGSQTGRETSVTRARRARRPPHACPDARRAVGRL